MEKPFFSVITPSWNQGKFLRACIESVVSQNDMDFEHLVFDNCSIDETTAVVEEFPHMHFVSEVDCGQSHAVNKGLAAARGEILCWLNSDDEYAPGAFAALRRAFEDPGVMVVFGDVRQIGYDGAQDVVARGRFGTRLDFVRWWSPLIKLHQPAVFFRRSILEKTGLLREDLHYALDYEFWWRMSENFEFVYLPEVLAVQHRQPDSKTILAWQRVLEEREQIFSPHYGLIDGGDRPALMREKRRELARVYLEQAYAAAGRGESLRLMLKSLLAQPREFFGFRWAGILRRALR